MTIEIRFISNNPFKIAEAKAILGIRGIDVVPFGKKIEELQTKDTFRLVEDKLVKAFSKVGRPLFVEHTGLYLEYIGGLPGGLTQIFWDSLEADKFAELFGARSPNPKVVARTTVGYCDGQQIFVFEGDVKGTIVSTPRGDRAFQWDCVFQPEGYSQTFAEMGDKKNEISMRRIALDALASHLENGVKAAYVRH